MTPGAHLNESELAKFLEGHLDPAARRAAIVHLDGCAQCRDELIAVGELASTYWSQRASLAPSRRRWLPIGAAIAAGLAGLVLFRVATGGRTPGDTVRAPIIGSAEAPRIIAVAPRDGATVTNVGLRFTWRPYDADSYRFLLLEEDGTPAWSLDTHDTSLVLPPSITLTPGKAYFWRVDALTDGITASTGTLRVQVPR